MADIDAEAARALCDAATPGPWISLRRIDGGIEIGSDSGGRIAAYCGRNDHEFIAAARILVPDLLDALAASEARVRELEAEREQINQVVTDLRDMCLEVEASGGLFYAPVHRMVALVAEIALRGSDA